MALARRALPCHAVTHLDTLRADLLITHGAHGHHDARRGDRSTASGQRQAGVTVDGRWEKDVVTFRSTHVRSTIGVLLVLLVSAWASASYMSIQDAVTAVAVDTMRTQIAAPSEELVTALQHERRLSLASTDRTAATPQSPLTQARAATDAAVAKLRLLTSPIDTGRAARSGVPDRVTDLLSSVPGLAPARDAIDRSLPVAPSTTRPARLRTEAGDAYTRIIDVAIRVIDAVSRFSDESSTGSAHAIAALTRCRELIAREDSQVTAAFAAIQWSRTDAVRLAQLVGAQRHECTDATSRLDTAGRSDADRLIGAEPVSRMRTAEDRLIAAAGPEPPMTELDWRGVADATLTQWRALEFSQVNVVATRGAQATTGALVRAGFIGGFGLIIVAVAAGLATITALSHVRQLRLLRDAARELAAYRLPLAVERLQRGEPVDVEHEAPPMRVGRDEIGQVGRAFNEVQQTAIRVAVEQSHLRRGVRDVFLSLARRSQTLLHRQLELLDAMERRATSSDELAELFRIDHLATRMRRNAENLIVLSGASAGRSWRRPVPMIDVVRGALAEVEDYTRVTISPIDNSSMRGRVVGDVIHLLAELIENAVSFSPPRERVHVRGRDSADGFVIEITDRGLGLSREDLQSANDDLANPPDFRLTTTARLGLYVVGTLARRHAISVRLTPAQPGGTTAIVVIPHGLMATEEVAAARTARPSRPPAESPRRVTAAREKPPEDGKAARAEAAAILGDRRQDPTVLTPSGLPWRQRTRGAPATGAADDGQPDPEAVAPMEAMPEPDGGVSDSLTVDAEAARTRMASYRSGTLRGRNDAARLDPNTSSWDQSTSNHGQER